MNRGLCALLGVGIGAGVMYLLDPHAGKRRRALLRDKLTKAANSLGAQFGIAVEDFENRAQGFMAETKAVAPHEQPVDDDVLIERVRAKLGRWVSHPRAIEVHACRGEVKMAGPILAKEALHLISRVRAVAGVRKVINQLEAHQSSDEVPRLQGGRPRPGEHFDLLQTHWAPATRLLVVGGGSALALVGLRRSGWAGLLARTAGTMLIAKGITGEPISELFSHRRPKRRLLRRAVTAAKIQAAVAQAAVAAGI